MQNTTAKPPNDTKKKILIIEDDVNTAKFISYRLKKLNFDILITEDGEQGLRKAKLEKPDVVILDLGLPKMTGEEVCKAIREDRDKKFSKIPIIMLTARNSDVDRVIGKVIGANCYMVKPFEAKDLLRQINKLLKSTT